LVVEAVDGVACQGFAAQFLQAFVNAAHAASHTAGQHDGTHVFCRNLRHGG
jgi:hypothetical protein